MRWFSGVPIELRDLAEGKVILYGTSDVARDEALMNVGITHETAELAVESVQRLCRLLGRKSCSRRSDSSFVRTLAEVMANRLRSWKLHLQKLSDQLTLPITVCHYPPGTVSGTK